MLPPISYNDTINTFLQIKKVTDHNIVIRNKFLLPHGKNGEVICAQVKAWDSQFDQEQKIFLVSLSEVQATSIMTYDAITKSLDMQLQQES